MTSPDFRLRAPEPDDIDILYRWENDSHEWRNSLTQVPATSRNALWRYLENFTGDAWADGQTRFMIEAGGVTVGTVDLCDLSARDHRAFVSIYIAGDHRRKGHARLALETVAEMAAECFGIETLAALVGRHNEASIKLFETSGYRLLTVLPAWMRHRGGEREDVLLYVLRP